MVIFMHKLKLPLGPWSTEPDEKSWVDPATGLHCYIKRNESGALCGYVGVPSDHPAYGHGYDEYNFDVHGGVTHADFREDWPMPDLCLWWVGFDCNHAFDFAPAMRYDTTLFKNEGAYRDMDYVTHHCTQLAKLLTNYTPPMSVREALEMVVRVAEQTDAASSAELGEACALVREHINELED